MLDITHLISQAQAYFVIKHNPISHNQKSVNLAQGDHYVKLKSNFTNNQNTMPLMIDIPYSKLYLIMMPTK